jgi:hypothetical protein
MQQTSNECTFSIELKAKKYLKTVNLTNGTHESVLVEGTIGQIQHAEFTEGIVLEVTGTKGILRIDLSPDQIKHKTDLEVKKQ